MNFWESVRAAIEGVWTNKLRSSLTMLGIIIGIAAVIAVVAVGQGGRAVLMSELERIGTNLFVVYINWNDERTPTPRDLTIQDAVVIETLAPSVQRTAPSSFANAQIQSGSENTRTQVRGTTASIEQIRSITITAGRFMTDEDVQAGRRVVVIDEELAEQLFPNQNPIGERVILNNSPTQVIGVYQTNETMFVSTGRLSTVYVPITYWQQLFNSNWVHQIDGQAIDRELINQAIDESLGILNRRHQTEERYLSWNLEQELEMADNMSGVMTLVIGAIAAISLFVGGIGVMNIMLVSVTERTREIGLRKALGATRKDILVQFLIEAVTICLIGGAIGILLGVGGAHAIAKIANWPPLISWSSILIAALFSVAVGLFFGIYPANKAAKMDPIEALRYE